jgi:hypothetical protein
VQIREYHRRHPAARVVDASEEYETLLKEEPQIEFSGEVGVSICFSLHTACLIKCLILVENIVALSQLCNQFTSTSVFHLLKLYTWTQT